MTKDKLSCILVLELRKGVDIIANEKLYNSACGIVGIRNYDEVAEFENDLKELEENPDFSMLGHFDLTQDADEELQYQGFTLDDITKMSLNQYGNVIECLHSPDSQTYWVFVGAR